MNTPAGKECRYFFGDYFRGRKREECRLLEAASPPLPWKPKLCSTCPVPGILLANACPHLVLEARLARPFPYIVQQVHVEAYCTKIAGAVKEAHIGCGECHPLPNLFSGGDSGADAAA